MTLRLASVARDADLDALVFELAPGFGGDPLGGREILGQMLEALTAQPRSDPWGCYLAYDGDVAVGTCAFKAGPDDAGAIELAYMTFPTFEGRGHATAMAGALVEIARSGGAAMVLAHTLPEENASTRALRRNGFIHVGSVIDPEDGLVWRWERTP